MPGRPAPGLRRAAGLALALGLFAPAPAPAQQEQSFGALLDRLDRLERGLEAVRRQGGAPAPAPGAAAEGSLDAFAGRESRFSGIEEQLRSLTDRVERAEFGLRGLVDALSRDVGELQRRLAALEAAAPASPALAGPAAAPPAIAAAPPAAGGVPEAPPPTPAAAATPESEYERAYELLARADYAGAESALGAFVDRHPEHALAGNAWYWLGETHYARRDFERAAVAFARGYKGFPDGGKTADNLLKLGMSFAAMGRTEEACATFAKLRGDRPDAPAIIRERLAGESARAGCP